MAKNDVIRHNQAAKMRAEQLNEVFTVEIDGGGNYVTLKPKLANYRGELSYDEAGNANITIIRNSDDKIMLDASLDNGEVNDMDNGFFQ